MPCFLGPPGLNSFLLLHHYFFKTCQFQISHRTLQAYEVADLFLWLSTRHTRLFIEHLIWQWIWYVVFTSMNRCLLYCFQIFARNLVTYFVFQWFPTRMGFLQCYFWPSLKGFIWWDPLCCLFRMMSGTRWAFNSFLYSEQIKSARQRCQHTELMRQRQKGHEFKASVGNLMRSCFKNPSEGAIRWLSRKARPPSLTIRVGERELTPTYITHIHNSTTASC